MKKNYLAWNIEYDNFFQQPLGRSRLEFLVQFAVLAPSSHNSQPWKFEVGENYIFIKPDFSKHLAVSDPENRHLYIALGCATENILVSADYYGLQTTVQYLPPERKDSAVKIYFKPALQPLKPNQHLIFSIASRRSNRNKYTSRAPDAKFIERIGQLSSNGALVSLIQDKREKKKVANILIESRLNAFSNKAFRTEMANYKRTNFTSSPFGMPGFTLGINNLLSLVAPFLIKNFNIMKVIRKNEELLLNNHTPIFLFLNSKENNPLSWLNMGQILQKIILEAEYFGIQTAMSALPPDVEPIQKILKTSYRPQMFLRAGYAIASAKHSPRLQAEETLIS